VRGRSHGRREGEEGARRPGGEAGRTARGMGIRTAGRLPAPGEEKARRAGGSEGLEGQITDRGPGKFMRPANAAAISRRWTSCAGRGSGLVASAGNGLRRSWRRAGLDGGEVGVHGLPARCRRKSRRMAILAAAALVSM
jgi:hypothetical protein